MLKFQHANLITQMLKCQHFSLLHVDCIFRNTVSKSGKAAEVTLGKQCLRLSKQIQKCDGRHTQNRHLGFMLCDTEIVQLLRDEKSACDLRAFILAEFDDGICGRYMGVVAVFYLTENLFTGQLNDNIDLFLIILCLSEVAELRRTAPVEGYDRTCVNT